MAIMGLSALAGAAVTALAVTLWPSGQPLAEVRLPAQVQAGPNGTSPLNTEANLEAVALQDSEAGGLPVAPLPPAPDGPALSAAPAPSGFVTVPRSAEQMRLSFAPIVRQTAPAVVNVYTRRKVTTARGTGDPMFDMLFGGQFTGPPRQEQGSLGSGVILRENGVIVTNNHVIEGADELIVVLADRREYPAEVLLADPRTDIAVLKIEARGLATVPLADTRSLEVGDLVLAIGNPFGVGQTVTSGIVSALARTDVGVTDFAFFIQTDAAINPGNSGGALVDASGALIGVNTAIFSRSGTSSGVGFAIPAEMVRRIVTAAVDEGRVIRPWLGIKSDPVTTQMAEALGLPAPLGVVVTEVFPDSPADKASIRRGDVILRIDGRDVFDEGGVRYLSAVRRPGEQAEITVLRTGQQRKVRVNLEPPPGARDAEVLLVEGQSPITGAEVAALSPAMLEEMSLDPFRKGLMVNRLYRNSLAHRFGLRPGDLIETVNGQRVSTLEDLRKAIARQSTGVWRVEIDRGGRKILLQARV